jgi:hypothetical protein
MMSRFPCHRDGSEVSRNPKTGDVLAEIVLQANGGGRMAALTSYAAPWPLGMWWSITRFCLWFSFCALLIQIFCDNY